MGKLFCIKINWNLNYIKHIQYNKYKAAINMNIEGMSLYATLHTCQREGVQNNT